MYNLSNAHVLIVQSAEPLILQSSPRSSLLANRPLDVNYPTVDFYRCLSTVTRTSRQSRIPLSSDSLLIKKRLDVNSGPSSRRNPPGPSLTLLKKRIPRICLFDVFSISGANIVVTRFRLLHIPTLCRSRFNRYNATFRIFAYRTINKTPIPVYWQKAAFFSAEHS
ncbi:hypothetical protein ARMGADRAFT_658049 [Armillaria gallica]|uniref:Uncharacterized protein n=1 Tax=Armillaria gallica TaxID=47427 RepID=A0A2H3DUX6_ARMGA|nr:hypothetical protein ARMGADRAFT_658049 [Armillaria gallica]